MFRLIHLFSKEKYTHNFKNNLLIYIKEHQTKGKIRTERQRERPFHVLFHTSNGHNSQIRPGWRQDSGLILVSQVDGRSPNTWVITCSLPKHITRKLDQKPSSIDLNWYSDTGCGSCKQQLDPSHHNASSHNSLYGRVGYKTDFFQLNWAEWIIFSH